MMKIYIYFCLSFIFLCQTIQAERLKLALEWLINPHHAPIVIALTQGYFQEEGLEVELIQGQGSLEGCIQVSAGIIDLALTNEAQWMVQTDKGLTLEPVLTLINQPLEVFISRVPLNELKGKRIGHSSSGVGFSAAVLNHILARQNLTVEDVALVHTKYNLVASLLSGQADAVVNAYWTYATVDLKQHGKEFYVYKYEELGVPLFAAQIIVAHPKISLKAKQGLKKALIKACQFLKNYPDKAWEIFKTYKRELDTTANKKIWPVVINLFKVEEPAESPSEHYQKLKEFLIRYKLIKTER